MEILTLQDVSSRGKCLLTIDISILHVTHIKDDAENVVEMSDERI